MKKIIEIIPVTNTKVVSVKEKISVSSLRPSGKKVSVSSGQSACGNVCG